jgi:hypothetical protein
MQIYKVINKINQKWYIGKDAGDRSYYFGSGIILKHAIKKYGKDNFEKIILETCKSKEELCEREIHWIAITNAVNDPMSYNLASGGEGGDLSAYIDYENREYKGDRFKAAREWYQSLTVEQQKDLHKKQAEKRCKVWYVSKIDTPEIEIRIVNLSEWERQTIPGYSVRCTADIDGANYGKSIKGWRCRFEDDSNYPPYVDLRKIGHANIACKGKNWKLVDGKRVWSDKQ